MPPKKKAKKTQTLSLYLKLAREKPREKKKAFLERELGVAKKLRQKLANIEEQRGVFVPVDDSHQNELRRLEDEIAWLKETLNEIAELKKTLKEIEIAKLKKTLKAKPLKTRDEVLNRLKEIEKKHKNLFETGYERMKGENEKLRQKLANIEEQRGVFVPVGGSYQNELHRLENEISELKNTLKAHFRFKTSDSFSQRCFSKKEAQESLERLRREEKEKQERLEREELAKRRRKREYENTRIRSYNKTFP